MILVTKLYVLYSGSCVDAGYTGCCVNGNCEGISGEIPFPCYCDSLCYAFGDCCDDIHLIGCPHPNSKYLNTPPIPSVKVLL